MAERKNIVVDGANVAHEEKTKDGKPKVSNIVAMQRTLEEQGFDPIVIVDASLWHEVDDPDQLDAMIEQERIHQVPAGTDADYFVLEMAQERDARVVSNDRFGDRKKDYPWIEERRVPFMIVEGGVQLYEEALEASR